MKNKNLPVPLIIAAVVLVLGVVGIIVYATNGDSGTPGSSTQSESTSGDANSSVSAADAEETDTVEISSFEFKPPTIKVKVGTKVTWTNKDTVQHNVVGDDFKDLDGPLLNKGETFSFTFDKAGTYPYHCMPHPYMKGTVIVTE